VNNEDERRQTEAILSARATGSACCVLYLDDLKTQSKLWNTSIARKFHPADEISSFPRSARKLPNQRDPVGENLVV
jgi:hypothetical protein